MAILQSNSVYAFSGTDSLTRFVHSSELSFQGSYSASSAYIQNDVVSYSTSLYVAILPAGTSVSPSSSSAYWSALALARSGGSPVASNEGSGRLTYTCDTLASLKSIPHDIRNWRATLLGESEAFDGMLQGDYYWRESSEDNNDGSVVRGDDYQGFLWKKL